jgi:hypothetical protein
MLCNSKEIYGFQDNNNKINSNILLSKLRIWINKQYLNRYKLLWYKNHHTTLRCYMKTIKNKSLISYKLNKLKSSNKVNNNLQ